MVMVTNREGNGRAEEWLMIQHRAKFTHSCSSVLWVGGFAEAFVTSWLGGCSQGGEVSEELELVGGG